MKNLFTIGMLLLKVADLVFSYLRERQLLDAGADREIARTTASIAAKTKVANEVWIEVNGLSESDVDDGLRGLEPTVGKNPPTGQTRTS